jgi:RHS repeat-associated protein
MKHRLILVLALSAGVISLFGTYFVSATRRTVAIRNNTLSGRDKVAHPSERGEQFCASQIRNTSAQETLVLQETVAGQSATLLPDGRLLVVGGEGHGGPAEIRDPKSNKAITIAKGLQRSRAHHSATLLPDGNVLIWGGEDDQHNLIDTAQLFNAVTQQFEPLSITGLTPRAHHSATLLMDGRVLFAGGSVANASRLEFLDPKSKSVVAVQANLITGRQNHSASLMADGNVLLWGGQDQDGNKIEGGEIFDAQTQSLSLAGEHARHADASPPYMTASFPQDGEMSVAEEIRIAVRFSKALRVESLNEHTVVLSGPRGKLAAKVIPAEAGRLLFVTPLARLESDSSYHLVIDGAADPGGEKLGFSAVNFKTKGNSQPNEQPGGNTPRIIDEDSWIPEARNMNGDWSSGRPDSSSRSVPARTAASGETALAGQVLALSGKPLANVTLQIGERVALTDQTGRFLLSGLSAGRFDLTIQGETASRPGKRYATFDVLVDIASGKTNVLPYTIWLPVLDDQNKKALSIPTDRETVITTPRVPGMEVRVPASSVLRMPQGAHHQHGQMQRELSSMAITPIPVDRPPFPLPAGVNDGLLFTLQLHGARVEGLNGEKRPGMRIIFPNYQNLPAGDRVDFWNYDPAGVGWYLYGHGTVTSDRKQVVPDPGVGLQSMYCISLMNKGDAPPTGPVPCTGVIDGDPVHLDTGIFVYQETDLRLPDVISLELARSYRPNDPVQRSFGKGGNNPYDMYISGDTYNYGEIILPDGGRVRFDKIPNSSPAVYEHTSTPTRFYKATMTMITGVGPNGAWEVKLKDGTLYQFGIKVLFGDIFGPHSSITGLSVFQDRLGNKVTITRDNDFRMSRVTSPNGRWIQFAYSDASKRVAQATDSAGRTVSYTYDGSGRLWKVTDANGGITEFTYDAADRMATIKDPKNVVFLTNEYDANGRVWRQTLADTGVFQFAYTLDANNKVTQTDVTDPRGKVRRVTFNAGGYPTSETLALGTPEQQNYTYERQAGSNLLLSVIDSLGRKTAVSYDSLGNVTGITKLADTPNAVTASVTYHPTFGQIASITDFLNRTKSFAYDSSGRLVTVTDPLNNQTTFTYNSAGQLLTATNPLQQTTTFTYDGADLVAITDAAGRTTTRYIDAAGRVARVTNPLGSVSRYEYNNRNQLVRATDALQSVTALDHDPNGNPLSLTDARNNITGYTYDSMDRLITTRDPLSHDETYQYDLNGNLKQLTDRKGQIRNLGYDGLNRLTQIAYADSSTITYTYDAATRLTQIVDSLSGTITYTYDDLDRMTSETTPQGSVSYTYDAAGRRTSMTVAGQPTVNYLYDNGNRLTQITQGTSTVTFGYDAAGRRTSLTSPNGLVTEYAYSSASQLTSLTYKQGATTLGDLTFEYDANGRRTRIGGSFARSISPQALSLASYSAANQQVSFGGETLAYDLNGNLLSDGVNSYTWDARNRLVAMTGPNLNASFQYDAVGRRISKTINGVTTSFVFDGVNVVQEQSAQLGNANMLNGGIDEVLMRTDSAGTWSHLRDGLGSTLAVTDASGVIQSEYAYGAFGQSAVSGDSKNSAQYTGRENDGTGLYYYRARYYSPALQRFISEDPIRFAGGDVNLYAYVRNDPMNYTDPSGLDREQGWGEWIVEGVGELVDAGEDALGAPGMPEMIQSQASLTNPPGEGPSWATRVGSTRAQSTQQSQLMLQRSGNGTRTGTAPYGSAAQLLRRSPMGASNVITGAGGALLEVGPELYNTLHIIDCRNKNINDVLRHLGQIP